MSERVRDFIGILQANVELVNEVAKLESHTISHKYLVNLIEQLYKQAYSHSKGDNGISQDKK